MINFCFCCCCCTSNIDVAIRRTKIVLFIFITITLMVTINSIIDASRELNKLNHESYTIDPSTNSSTTTTTTISPIFQYLIRDERTLIIEIVLSVLIDLIGVFGFVGALKDNFWFIVVYEVGIAVVWFSALASLFLFFCLSFAVSGCLISAGYLGRLYKRQNKSKENKLTDSSQGSSETPTTGSSRSSNTQSPTTTSTATRPTEITLTTTSPTTSQLTTPTSQLTTSITSITPSIQITQESISQMISNYLESVTRSCNLSPREPPPPYDDVVLNSYVSGQPFDVNSEEINVDPKALQHQISDVENQSLSTHSHQDIHSQLEAHQPPFYKY